MTKILKILYRHQDKNYADFTAKLIPTVPRAKFIGIRTPEYKQILKEILQEAGDEIPEFLNELPHSLFEENILHSTYISQCKDFDEWVQKMEDFLPFVDNWAVSDGMKCRLLRKNHAGLIVKIREWIQSDLPYTKRAAMLFLKNEFLGDDFKSEYLEWAAKIRCDEYYVNMMRAWLFAEALVKQWEPALAFLKQRKLDDWTHNKAIQKARESLRITDERKAYLNTLKVQGKTP